MSLLCHHPRAIKPRDGPRSNKRPDLRHVALTCLPRLLRSLLASSPRHFYFTSAPRIQIVPPRTCHISRSRSRSSLASELPRLRGYCQQRLGARGSRIEDRGSRIEDRGSWLVARGSWLDFGSSSQRLADAGSQGEG
jgi:hypothetical protein